MENSKHIKASSKIKHILQYRTTHSAKIEPPFGVLTVALLVVLICMVLKLLPWHDGSSSEYSIANHKPDYSTPFEVANVTVSQFAHLTLVSLGDTNAGVVLAERRSGAPYFSISEK